jgi:hypothetical protein
MNKLYTLGERTIDIAKTQNRSVKSQKETLEYSKVMHQ